MDPPSPSSPKGPVLFGRVWRSSGTQSPSSQYSTPVHHKPRVVKQTSTFNDENSISEVLEVVETTPGSDPRVQTSQSTQEPLPRTAPAQNTRSQNNTNSQSTPKAARVIVTPKKNLTTVRTEVEQANNNLPMNEDEDMDGSYEDTHMQEEHDDAYGDAEDEEEASQEEDPLAYLQDDSVYTQRRAVKGKGALGKRAKGKAYFAGGKSPRGVGAKAPRNPTGAGKAPAISPREKQDQRRRVVVLNELPTNNNTKKKATRKKKKKLELLTMPVGTKPKATNGPRKRKSRWKQEVAKYQKSEGFMIPKKRFQNLVRQIVQDDLMESWKWARTALEALQWAAEQWVTEHLDLTNLCAIHGKRVTIMPKDSGLVKDIRQNVPKLRDSIVSRI